MECSSNIEKLFLEYIKDIGEAPEGVLAFVTLKFLKKVILKF